MPSSSTTTTTTSSSRWKSKRCFLCLIHRPILCREQTPASVSKWPDFGCRITKVNDIIWVWFYVHHMMLTTRRVRVRWWRSGSSTSQKLGGPMPVFSCTEVDASWIPSTLTVPVSIYTCVKTPGFAKIGLSVSSVAAAEKPTSATSSPPEIIQQKLKSWATLIEINKSNYIKCVVPKEKDFRKAFSFSAFSLTFSPVSEPFSEDTPSHWPVNHSSTETTADYGGKKLLVN